MKNCIKYFCFASLVLLSFSCKKKIEVELVKLKTAKEHVQNFYHAYPDSVGYDSIGKRHLYPVGVYYTIYAVNFKRFLHDDSLKTGKSELELYYSDFDFSSLLSRIPEKAEGIRIYEAISLDTTNIIDKPISLNYITFTEPDTTDINLPANDLHEQVFVVKNHKFDLREFREERSLKFTSIRHSHLSCAPNCPKGLSLLKN